MAGGPPPADAGPAPSHGTPAGATAAGGDPFEERPELFVGGAFVGGLALAILLKKLAPS
jgi:hypothetical protein